MSTIAPTFTPAPSLSATPDSTWTLRYDEWNPSEEPLREALCTLGNGYFATRGAAEETSADGETHYPGTYLAGGYNRLESEVSGRVIENEDLVNWPNWLCLSFRPVTEEWFSVSTADILDFQQQLDLRRGILERRVRFRHGENRITSLVCRRIVHMANPHLAAIQWTITPENWSGRIEIRSALDGSVSNQGVKRYRALSSQHLAVCDMGRIGEDGVYLAAQTTQSHIRMVQAMRTHVFVDGDHAVLERRTSLKGDIAEQRLFVECDREKSLRVEKIVAVHTSRDFAISEPATAAADSVNRAPFFDEMLRKHIRAWSRLWNRADIEIIDDCDWSQMVLRLHIFHLLQTTSFNSIDQDMGVPARGLHGEAYRGHIFWDEIFVFPFLNLRLPELTRSLLLYRYRRMDEARHLAQEAGYQGAMFPWQSGSNGREESQVLHLNPKSGRWVPDNTFRQRHINAAIAYNVWQYYQATEDRDFLSFCGAAMLLEIARFWSSIAIYNGDRERYEIHGVVGPDEFHTEYPDSDSLGLKNNAYTNFMAVWVINCALRALEQLSERRRNELIAGLNISDEEFKRWKHICHKMYIPFHDGVISQFEGYEDLEEFDWEGYREKYGDIQRLERILEAEGDTANRYKVSKQADVLMLFYLFSTEELTEHFERLGYEFCSDVIYKTIDYYLERTSHGSTLSRVVHSWILARSARKGAWELFEQALESDVGDIQGGTTQEGIHLGAMAGTVDLIQRCHTGIEMRDDVLWFNPRLPTALTEIRFGIRYRGHWLKLHFTHDEMTISFEHGRSGPAKIGFRGECYEFQQGESRTFSMQ